MKAYLEMEMPQHCGECGVEWCNRWKNLIVAGMPCTKERPTDCPLIPVPDHGRLIDANKLKDTLDYYIREAGWGDEINKALGWVKDEFIDSEPTVIPAST